MDLEVVVENPFGPPNPFAPPNIMFLWIILCIINLLFSI